MAHGLNSTKSPARPSHEALETHTHATEVGKSKQEKLDDLAMQSARRAENRIRANQDTLPGNTMFTK